MKNPTKVYALWLALFLIATLETHAQESLQEVPKHQIEFQHDNDFILQTDRYYSSGLYLTYRRRLDKGLFIPKAEQLSFQLQYLAFTPNNIEAFDPASFDRPYAGFLGLQSQWSLTKATAFFRVGILSGIVGPSSTAGSFQQWYHDNVVLFKTPTWASEIEDTFHINLELTYAKEWKWAPNPFGVHFALQSTAALGTKDIYAQQDAILYLGRRNPLSSSIAYDQINSKTREIFIALRAGYRLIGRNALLEGTLNTGQAFESNIKRGVLLLGFDFKHRSGQNYYTIGYRHSSKETNRVYDHQYIILSYGRSF